MNTVEKIAEVLPNKALQPRIATCPIMADTVKLLAEHGVKATENELREVLAQMIKAASVELGEEDLEQVTGGLALTTLITGGIIFLGAIAAYGIFYVGVEVDNMIYLCTRRHW